MSGGHSGSGPDGQSARMTDEQFAQQLQDAQDAAAKYCTDG